MRMEIWVQQTRDTLEGVGKAPFPREGRGLELWGSIFLWEEGISPTPS